MSEIQELIKLINKNNQKIEILSQNVELIKAKIIPEGDLLTLQQVCRMLGRSTDYVGKLKHKIKLIDPNAKGHRKYIRTEVEKLLSY